MNTRIEVLVEGNAATSDFTTFEWVESGRRLAHQLDAGVGPWLEEFGRPSVVALGLARTAVGVFVADRVVRRNALRQAREIELLTWVPDVSPLQEVKAEVEAVLRWLTGDRWTLSFAQDQTRRPDRVQAYPRAEEVSLLSGGLDSFCGALIKGVKGRLFLSHSDAPVIKHSQTDVVEWLSAKIFEPCIVDVRLALPPRRGREPSRRSRSFLFIGLAIALADAVGAGKVEVPENGFTSLNVPLAANRGGVLTTRSTHPWTFELLTRMIEGLRLPISLINPYEFFTKGEVVTLAAESRGETLVEDGLCHTLSCAKSNPILHGSGFGNNCGLDYACIVRRGGIKGSGLHDATPYLVHTLTEHEQLRLRTQRRADVSAVRLARQRGASMDALLGSGGMFPDGYDFSRALDLWTRGLKEISHVPLP